MNALIILLLALFWGNNLSVFSGNLELQTTAQDTSQGGRKIALRRLLYLMVWSLPPDGGKGLPAKGGGRLL